MKKSRDRRKLNVSNISIRSNDHVNYRINAGRR